MRLSKTQRATLEKLAERWQAAMLHATSGQAKEQAWLGKPCRNSTTLFALEKRGLIEVRLDEIRPTYEARITMDGLELLSGRSL